MHRSTTFLIAAITACLPLSAQWVDYPSPDTPRTRDGKPNFAARPPRTREGKPDLSGLWHDEITSVEEWRRRMGDATVQGQEAVRVSGMGIGTNSIYASDLLIDLKPNELLRPEAVGRMHQQKRSCLPAGFPLATLRAPVWKIIQTPKIIVMLLEDDNAYRQIYMDGRPLPRDPQPSWYGYSVGNWERDTLVVETTGLNDKAPIDGAGHPRSEAMHMTERYRRRDFGHMELEITFNDPVYYTKPFTVKLNYVLQADSDILEYICQENEKDVQHMRRN